MSKIFLISGSVLAGLGVAIGAFGAHALKAILESTNRVATFETGVKYQIYHAIALLILGILLQRVDHKFFVWSGYSFMVGVLLFSGSLFILSISGVTKWGMVTPLGGVGFILGWLFLLLGVLKTAN